MTQQERSFRGVLRAYLFGALVVAATALAHISLGWS